MIAAKYPVHRVRRAADRLRRLHRNEHGTISIISVFAILMFTILLVMVTNVAKHLDDKVRMQNAADAATYSGGVVLARGMNTIAFTNHLLCEVFALTAYMREGIARDDGSSDSIDTKNVESLVPDILAAWKEIAPIFQAAEFEKFQRLGEAIEAKVPLEEDLVEAWGKMTYRHAEMTLPALEYVLAGNSTGQAAARDGGLIPQFQRELIRGLPAMGETAAREVALRYGPAMEVVIWHTDGAPVRQVPQDDVVLRMVPAIDPSWPLGSPGPDASQLLDPSTYLATASNVRRTLANRYLGEWTDEWMHPYFGDANDRSGSQRAKMSQMINLWRSATRERLRVLLEDEYPTTNLPHILRAFDQPFGDARLEQEYNFIVVTYAPHVAERGPLLFQNPVARDGRADSLAFAQAMVFVPKNRRRYGPVTNPRACNFGDWEWGAKMPGPDPVTGRLSCANPQWIDFFEQRPESWDLFNQSWMAQLVPADSANSALPEILQTRLQGLRYAPPNLGKTTMDDLRKINFH